VKQNDAEPDGKALGRPKHWVLEGTKGGDQPLNPSLAQGEME
jgi:hypothetical protein